jgi:hypothetical protein
MQILRAIASPVCVTYQTSTEVGSSQEHTRRQTQLNLLIERITFHCSLCQRISGDPTRATNAASRQMSGRLVTPPTSRLHHAWPLTPRNPFKNIVGRPYHEQGPMRWIF